MPELSTVSRWVENPALSIAALVEGSKRIHLGSLEIEQSEKASGQALSAKERERAANVLREFADVFELCEVLCALFEAEETVGSLCIDQLDRDQIEKAITIVRDLTGLDPFDVMKRGERFLPKVPKAEANEPTAPVPSDLERSLLRMAESLLSANINLVEKVAASCGRQSLGHRSRTAYEWLRSFVFRRGAEQGKQVRAAGQAYAESRLSLAEVASVLGVPIDEAIWLLEQYGYSRSVARIRLTNEQRKARLAALRADRIARKDQPKLDEAVVLRDVVASHRIEDLDARPWLQTTPQK